MTATSNTPPGGPVSETGAEKLGREQTLEKRRKKLRLALAEANRIANQLGRLDRGPFREFLVELLGSAPEPDALARFADKNPDKWAQAVTIMAGLAGFEKGVVVNIGQVNVTQMTDAQLIEESAKAGLLVAGRLGPHVGEPLLVAVGGDVVDAVVVEKSGASREGNGFPSAPGGTEPRVGGE